MKINRNAVIVLILFLITLISYINIFQNEFVWDDNFFIVNNIHIRDLGNIPGFFAEPSTGNLYRPLRSVFYTINYQIWDLNVFGYHLNSFLLHFSVTLLLFFITLKITGRTWFSFVVSLFFAAHPVHTARITNMTATFDGIGILFLLLSFFFYIKFSGEKKKNYYFLSILFYLIAILSTEESITLILILFLYDFSFNKHKINLENIRLLFKKYLPYMIITVFYLIIRFLILRQVGRGEYYFEHSFFGTLLTTVKIFVDYIVILIFPYNLNIERYVKFETFPFSISFFISLIVLLFVLFFFIKSYKRSKIMFFSIGWFFVTLIPFSNLVPQFTIMADRYLYLPSYGFCLFLTFLLYKIKTNEFIKKHGKIPKESPVSRKLQSNFLGYSKAVFLVLVISIASAYVVLTIQRNAEWKDNFTLLSTSVERNPLGTKTNDAMALYYRDMGDYDNALKYASNAVDVSSKNYHAYENLGTIHVYLKDYDAAIDYYNKAIEINPEFYQAHNNLGLVYSYKFEFNKSVNSLKKAIEIDPSLAKAHNDLGTIYAKLGYFDEGIEEISKAIEINPYEADYYYNLAVIYEFLEDNVEAENLLLKALEVEPDDENAIGKLAKLKS